MYLFYAWTLLPVVTLCTSIGCDESNIPRLHLRTTTVDFIIDLISPQRTILTYTGLPVTFILKLEGRSLKP